MKKNLFAFATLAICTTCLFTSCEEKATYKQPSIASITLSPSTFYEGEAVTATIVYANEGENWYYSTQVFSIDGKVVQKNIKQQYSALPKIATCEFTAPAAGKHTISFSGLLTTTAGDVLFTDIPTYSQSFTVLDRNEE